MGAFSVSVNLHEIGDSTVVYKRAAPRIRRFFNELSIKGTFFVVGADVTHSPHVSDELIKLLNDGHEIANHTHNHPKDLTIQSSAFQREQILKAHWAIQQACGATPVGFRAPGCSVNLGLLDVVDSCDYLYDSSVFPSPLEVIVKTAKMAVAGIQKTSVDRLGNVLGNMGDPRILNCPTAPYQLGRDGVWSKGRGLTELPISVVTRAKIPFSGSYLVKIPPITARLLAVHASKMGFVNLKLNGLDFLDTYADALKLRMKHQPNLYISHVKKMAILSTVIKTLLRHGGHNMTLAQAAKKIII